MLLNWYKLLLSFDHMAWSVQYLILTLVLPSDTQLSRVDTFETKYLTKPFIPLSLIINILFFLRYIFAVWINIESPYFLTDNCFYDLYHKYSATFIEHGWVIFLVLRIIRIPSLSSWCCDWWCVLSYLNKMTLTHIGVKYISFWVNTRLYNMLCFKLVILMYSILSKHCLICSNHIIDF